MRGTGRAGSEARHFERLSAQAKRAYARGDIKRGDQLAGRAEGIKAGLEARGILPKDDAAKFKSALEAAEVLQKIAANTAGAGKFK
jgi:hypothetical protein